MARVCCVCGGADVHDNEDIILFDFPVSAYLRRKWKDAIQLSGRITYDSLVCSKHFEKSQYKTLRGKPRLIGRVVPSLYLNNKNNVNSGKKTNSDENSIDNVVENSSTEKTKENISSLDTEINIDLVTSLTCKEKRIDVSEKETSRNSPKDGTVTDSLTNNIPEENLNDISEKLQSVSEISEKLLSVNEIAENVQTVNEISKKLQSTSENSEKLQCASENSEKLQSVGEISEKLQNLSETSEELDCTVSENNESSVNEKFNFSKSVEEINSGYFYSKEATFHNGSKNRDNKMKCTPILSQPDPKEDIEDILTNYHIQNKGQLVMESDRVDDGQPEVQTMPEKEPVFIEISVGRDPLTSVASDVPGSQDCLMVLESVQVDVDPSSFLLPEQEYDIAGDDDDDEGDDDDVQITENKKSAPISLLTSSDESDVILEEPNIDTVEVSDETDEDDVPLVRLLPKNDKNDKNATSQIAKIMWGLYEYYCIQCKFYSTSKNDYIQHVKEHEKVLQMCQICGYTTASKYQFYRHRRKHKDDRRFKCHLCDYKAKHNMSLMYHLKTHDTQNGGKGHKPGYSCHCGFRTNDKTTMLKHVRACKVGEVDESPKKYSCKNCSYSSNRRGDLKRHVLRKHTTIGDDDDDYLP